MTTPCRRRSGAALAGLESRGERQEALDFLLAHARRLKASIDADPGAARTASRFPEQSPRVVFIVEQVPRPDDAVTAPVILSHITAMQQLGYAVSLVAGEELAPPSSAVARLEALNVECCRQPDYASVEELLRRDPDRFQLVYVHGAVSAELYLSLARRRCRNARLVYSVGELQTIRLARQAAVLKRPMLRALSNRRHLAECSAASTADAVITHSAAEAEWLRNTLGISTVHVIPWLVAAARSTHTWGQRSGVAMLADFGDPANLDAAHHLAQHVMQLIRSRIEDFECVIAGPHMPESLYKLPGIVPIGEVAGRRADLRARAPDGRAAALRCRRQRRGARQHGRRRAVRHERGGRRGPVPACLPVAPRGIRSVAHGGAHLAHA